MSFQAKFPNLCYGNNAKYQKPTKISNGCMGNVLSHFLFSLGDLT